MGYFYILETSAGSVKSVRHVARDGTLGKILKIVASSIMV